MLYAFINLHWCTRAHPSRWTLGCNRRIIKDYGADLLIFSQPWRKPRDKDLGPPPLTFSSSQLNQFFSFFFPESDRHLILLSTAGSLGLALSLYSSACSEDMPAINISVGGVGGFYAFTSKFQTEGGMEPEMGYLSHSVEEFGRGWWGKGDGGPFFFPSQKQVMS